MLKILAGVVLLIVGWFCVALLQVPLGIACIVDFILKALSRFFDWVLLVLLRTW